MKKLIRAKGSLQNKFLIMFIFISIIPMVVCMIYISTVALEQMTENVEQTSVSQLKNIDQTIYERYKNIKKTVDNICANTDIQQILSEDNLNYELFASQIKSCTVDNEDIFGIACVTKAGNAYTYNVRVNSIDATRLQIMYGRFDERPGMLTWFGNSFLKTQGFDENIIMAVTTYNRLNGDNGYEQLAQIYIYVKNNIFSDAFGDVGDNSLLIFDSNGMMLSGIGRGQYIELFNEDMSLIETLFSQNEGVMKTDILSKKNVSFAHYSSGLTDFRYLKIYDNDVLYEKTNEMRRLVIIFIIALSLVALMIYVTIVNKITKPIEVLAEHMRNMSWNNLGKKVRVGGWGEITDIMNGYNRMLDKISDMIDEVKEKEKQKKESDIRALNYQINPHFLHNTLASIRIVAMKHNDTEVSQAILDINRILKSVFSSSSRKIVIKEEIKLLDSFSRLLSLRYNGRIEFNIRAEAETENMIIPSMIIQPLLENAVMHGVTPKMRDSEFKPRIDIDITKEKDNLKISIRDNGVGIDMSTAEKILNGSVEKNGVGMANVNERVKLICGEEYGFSVESHMGEYTDVMIILPIE